MKNVYKILLLIGLFFTGESDAQTYVVWDTLNSGVTLTGNYPGGVVNVTSTGLGVNVQITSPAWTPNNLVVGGNNTFNTIGAINSPPSRSLTFDFSTPVIVTRYNMADIDLGATWNDSFDFSGISFNNRTSLFCNATLNGVTATTEVGSNSETAYWFCSEPVTSFSLNYRNTNGLTHDYLAYSVEVLPIPVIEPICLNSGPVQLPDFEVIIGDWSPGEINTSTEGVFQYTFTPGSGQSISCPITIEVSIVSDCCQPDEILISPDHDMDNNSTESISWVEREFWIQASNIVNIGNNDFQDGVVYHAGDFVELIPGFEAIYGSQFSAYPQGCTGDFAYRNLIPVKKEIVSEVEINHSNRHQFFTLSPNPANNNVKIQMSNTSLKALSLISIDGKKVFETNFEDSDAVDLDVSHLPSGIYIVEIINGFGFASYEKLVKN